MMKNRTVSAKNQAGFTIVELMIATMVFSVVIFIITAGVLAFTRSYYKGVNSSTTQNTARSIMNAVTQAIQFSGQTVYETNLSKGPLNGYFCAGDYIYMYSLGKQVPDTPTRGNWGLYRATNPVPGSCTDLSGPPADGSGTELLGPHMRVADFKVAQVPSEDQLYSLNLRIAYGDNDLLCTPDVSGSCTANTELTDAQLNNDKVTCKSQTGSQFCAVSALTTTVLQRVKPNN
jgi:prepilin-type N-terminal cleavage/methylation domain-containing protein